MMKEVRLPLVHYSDSLRHDTVVQSLHPLFLAGACILVKFANKKVKCADLVTTNIIGLISNQVDPTLIDVFFVSLLR